MTECDKAEFLVSAPLDEFPSVSYEILGNSSSGAKVFMTPWVLSETETGFDFIRNLVKLTEVVINRQRCVLNSVPWAQIAAMGSDSWLHLSGRQFHEILAYKHKFLQCS